MLDRVTSNDGTLTKALYTVDGCDILDGILLVYLHLQTPAPTAGGLPPYNHARACVAPIPNTAHAASPAPASSSSHRRRPATTGHITARGR